jgi:hypothetical protein
MLVFVLLFCLFSPPASGAGDPSPDVPQSDPVYSFLDRMEVRGLIGSLLPGDRPWTARFVARQLSRIDTLALSRTERSELSRYRSAFAGRPGVRPFGGLRYAYRDSSAEFWVEPLLRQAALSLGEQDREGETVSWTYAGGRVQGEAFGRLGFRAGHFEAREWSTRGRRSRKDVLARPLEDPQFKGREDLPGGPAFHTVDFRESRYQLVWSTPWFTLDAGKESFTWGPSRDANLLLHDAAPSYAYGRLRVAYRAVRFTHLVAVLRARPGTVDSTRTVVDNGHTQVFAPLKRMAAHRLEIAISSRFRLGLQEAVVYGRRGFDFPYMIPVAVMVGTQSFAGSTDNLTFGLDAAALLPGRLKIYGALFFDDLRKFSPGAFANKHAVQVGAFWANPLGVPDTDLRAEYVRLEPFVYSHDFSINTWEHFDALLGHPAGPNADRLSARLEHRVGSRLEVGLGLARERRGENPVDPSGTITNVGGDAELGRRPADPERKEFLAGRRETETLLRVEGTFFLWPTVRVRAGHNRSRVVGPAPRLEAPVSGGHHQTSISLEINAF